MKNFIFSMVVLLITSSSAAQFVGVGTSNPYSRFHLDGTAWFQGDNTPLSTSAGAGIGIGFGAGSSGGYIFAWNYGTGSSRNLWLNHTGGNVLINSTSSFPSGRLDVTGNGQRAIYASTSSGEALYGYTGVGNAITGLSASNLGGYFKTTASSGGLLAEGLYIGAQGTATGSDVNRQAIRGEVSGGGYAGVFVNGTTAVFGTLTKSAGAFMIDHPVEPETKYLVHSFVESPDMKNIYDGVVVTNEEGFAKVTLPGWFQALNMEFRYQLTCIGQFAQAIIQDEISANSFSIRTDKPAVKVSWQVTGIRHDPYANDNRLQTEKPKRPDEVGKYIYPKGYGLSDDKLLDILKPTNLASKEKMNP